MANKLPTYKISINPELAENGEDLGIDMVAYTDTPAILTKGLAFNSSTKMIFTDTLKYRLAAPGMIPDQLIYREDDDLGAYNVVFTKEMIVQMRDKFMKDKRGIVFNLDHNQELEAPSYILEEWITGPSATDRSFTEFGVEVPEGSWFIVSQFVDRNFFKEEIINKNRTGYSIEGMLSLEFEQIIKEIKQNKMEKQTFETKVGDASPLEDGSYKMKNGDLLIVKDEVIVEIKKAEEAPIEAAKEEPKAEEAPVAEEVKEEEMAEPVIEEVPVVEAPVSGPLDEAAILAIVKKELEPLYAIIADLKTKAEADAVEDVAEEVVMGVTAQQALEAFFKAKK